jgi:hypothetical protein
MHEWQLTWIKPDMDVYDSNGERIGAVAHVYRPELAAVESAAEGGPPHEQDVLEVKTGLLGLGKHYYIPLRAVQDVTHAVVTLAQRSDELASLGWDTKPAHLEEGS